MKKRADMVWSADDCERLIEAVETGVSPIRAATMFGRTVMAVQNQARKLGKPFPTILERRRNLREKISAAESRLTNDRLSNE